MYALNHTAVCVSKFYCVKLREARSCDFELMHTEEHASIYIQFDKVPRNSWWMLCLKGEQHVIRGKDESRRTLENVNTVTRTMKSIHHTARPSNQAACTQIFSQTLSS